MVATVLHGDAPKSAPPALGNQKVPRDLYRFIYVLSGACERDCNVLRDGKLVDHLESQAKQIIRARRQNRSGSMASASSFSSSSSSVSQRTTNSPMLKPITNTVAPANSKLSKRRKLPGDKTTAKSPVLYGRSTDADKENADEASLVMARGDGSSSVIPAVKISKLARPQAPSTFKSRETSLKTPGSVDKLPTKVPRKSVDLGASMASTVSSASLKNYDLSDVEDVVASALTPTARYASTKSVYGYNDYTPPREKSRRSSALSDEQPFTPTTDLDDSLLHVSELGSVASRRKDSCYSESSTSSYVGPKKLRFEMDALSLYETEPGLHMSSVSSIKNVESSLVETLQSQVDLLLSENVKALAENARLLEVSQMSSAEAEEHALEKRRVLGQIQRQNAELTEIQRKLKETEVRANAQEVIRREAEAAFQAELDAKSKLLMALQGQVHAKDEEIVMLSKRVEDITGLFGSKVRDNVSRRSSLIPLKEESSGAVASAEAVADEEDIIDIIEVNHGDELLLELELQRLKATLLEKDREICNLYMHLSTKKKLIEEITKKFVQHMEEAAATAKATEETKNAEASDATFPTEGVRFDLDVFLFKNVVDKQRQVEELTAALGVMDREVEGLEARVAEKERENSQLRENQEYLTRSLQALNAQLRRIETENERLESSNQEKQARITTLAASLEEKECHILHLDEQVEFRQTQIDHLMSDKEKLSASGRRSLKNSLFKPRASLGSSAVKNPSSRSSVLSFSSTRGVDDENFRRSSLQSSQRPSMGESRASIVSDSDFATTKRTSLFSQMFDDISSPMEETDDDEEKSNPFAEEASSSGEVRSTRASYCASEINDDEELYNELFAKA